MQLFPRLRQLFAMYFGNKAPGRALRNCQRPCRYRPAVEILEDRLAPAALATVASFGDTTGTHPQGGLIEDTRGDLFGTTQTGGAFGYGAIFEIKAGTNTITTLASFTGTDGGNGANPWGSLVEDSQGDLFGTTPQTVFELKAGSTVISTISFPSGHTFVNGLVMDARGELFATAGFTTPDIDNGGGAIKYESVWEFSPLSGSTGFAPLAFFDNGLQPVGGLAADANGDLFGTTENGGAYGYGLIFEMKAGTNTITTLASFSAANGFACGALTLDSSGNLYGTTQGSNLTTFSVYELKAGSGTITNLVPFENYGISLGFTWAGLTVDGSGNLFATTTDNKVVEVKVGSGTITTIGSFNDANTILQVGPAINTITVVGIYSPLLVDANGNVIGTTWGDGANNDGSVYELAGAATPLPNSGGSDAADLPRVTPPPPPPGTPPPSPSISPSDWGYHFGFPMLPVGTHVGPDGAFLYFVNQAYGQLLHRDPDAAGLPYWTGLLNSGASPSSVILGIEHSTEYLKDEVTALYQQFLNRAPGAAGLQSWVSQLQGGATIQQVEAGILGSAEYFADKGGSAAFVGSLYQNLLGRTGSTTEVQGWLDALAGGMSRYQVASSFLSSQGYATRLIDSYYTQFLGRSPDAAGLAAWLQQYRAGVNSDIILAGIFGSAEGYAKWS